MNPKVAIVMGSDSDLELMREAAKVLDDFDIGYELKIMSAHRSPKIAMEFSSNAKKNGFQVIIAGAGGAAHLAGVVAAHTVLPVIGVPIDSSPLKGFDALLSTVQMPAGIPVATVSVGKWGARNAGILAVQIMALAESGLTSKLEDFKKKLEAGVIKKNENIKQK